MKNQTKTTVKTNFPKSLSRLPGRNIKRNDRNVETLHATALHNTGTLHVAAKRRSVFGRATSLLLVSFIFQYSLTINHLKAQVIAGGASHSLFACADSTVRSCGLNAYGQLGNGTTTSTTLAVQVSGLTGITAVAAGQHHSLFLKNDGTVWACGRNAYGRLGDGTTVNKTTAVQVSGLTGITAVAAGDWHSLFLKNDGTVWACGRNNFGQLGNGTTADKTTAVQVSGLTGITAVAAGGVHSLFLKNDGTVWACGSNWTGQLGDGTTAGKTTAVQVSGLTGITVVAAGGYYSLFLKNDGTVWACGSNWAGQLGDGTTADTALAVQVSGLTGITAVAAGLYYSLFVKNDGTVWACGRNNFGQLGNGTTADKTTAVQVSGLAGITAVAAGYTHSLFLKNDGTVWACGFNLYGQLGDGTTANKTLAVQVTGLCTVVAPIPPSLKAYIPDINFRNFLNTNYPAFMDGSGDSLLIDSAATLTGVLNCSNQNIADLTGVEYFVNITQLWCYNNQLTALPDFTNNTALYWLDCANNKLDFSDARALRIADTISTLTTYIYSPQDPFGVAVTFNLNAGETLILSIANQDSALSYQWFRGTDTIMGATDTLLIIPGVMEK